MLPFAVHDICNPNGDTNVCGWAIEDNANRIGLSFKHRRLEGDDGYSSPEYIKFNIPNAVKFILKQAFKLEREALHQSISLSTSIGTAQLSKRQVHTTMGIKINDCAATCPITRTSIFANSLTNCLLVQSRNNCFPLKVILTPETKGIYKHFADVLEYLQMKTMLAKVNHKENKAGVAPNPTYHLFLTLLSSLFIATAPVI